nr:SLC13 family permease [Flagellatimonas centrodinii]
MTLPDTSLLLTASVLVLLFVGLFRTRLAPDVLFIAAVTALLSTGVLTASEAFSGLSNQGVLTVAVLYVVAAAIKETGGVQWIVQTVLGKPRSVLHAQIRLMLPVTAFSAFLNNTPVVAMLIPAVSEWANRFKLPVSQLFIPLSYAAILGGTCTLIGTSTNLVVNGMLIEATGSGFSLFDLAPIGLPIAVLGLIAILVVSRFMLPDREALTTQLENVREYTIEMLVDGSGPLPGRSIEQAGLRHLPGCYLVEIERDGELLTGVSPQQRLEAADRLIFIGRVDSVVDLQKIRGLSPATDQVFKLSGQRSQRELIEAVVSDTSPMNGKTIKEGEFRTRYDAVVLAVARRGERMEGKLGAIRLQAGDTLLIEAGESFIKAQRHSRDFFLTRHIEGSSVPRHEKARLALGIMAGMVLAAGTGLLPMLEAALLAAGALVLTGCISTHAARSSIDWSVIIVIAAAFGLSAALDKTGLATLLAHQIAQVAGASPLGVLAAIFVATALLSAFMTNNAAAALMFPIALQLGAETGIAPATVALGVIFGASACYMTPIGYQTNLMVLAPGGYRFSDFVGIGAVLTVITGIVYVLMAGT